MVLLSILVYRRFAGLVSLYVAIDLSVCNMTLPVNILAQVARVGHTITELNAQYSASGIISCHQNSPLVSQIINSI